MHTAETALPPAATPSWPDRPLADPAAALLSPVLCADGLPRCPWALSSPHVLADHDTAWGSAPQQPSEWLRALCLEILQAGLAPGASVSRLPALEEVFSGFDPQIVAGLDDDTVDQLVLDRRLIRNRAKLTAVVLAARAVRGWSCEHWQQALAPEEGAEHVQVVVRRLREQGLAHAGPGTTARVLARTGMAPAHLDGCFRS